jgi:hypothetical protein
MSSDTSLRWGRDAAPRRDRRRAVDYASKVSRVPRARRGGPRVAERVARNWRGRDLCRGYCGRHDRAAVKGVQIGNTRCTEPRVTIDVDVDVAVDVDVDGDGCRPLAEDAPKAAACAAPRDDPPRRSCSASCRDTGIPAPSHENFLVDSILMTHRLRSATQRTVRRLHQGHPDANVSITSRSK